MADNEKAVVEEVKNCPSCNKPLKKARRFYRNGRYYCNNNCFKAAEVKRLEEKAKKDAEAAASGEAAPKE